MFEIIFFLIEKQMSGDKVACKEQWPRNKCVQIILVVKHVVNVSF